MTLPQGWEEANLLEIAEIHDSRRIPLNQAQRQAAPGPYPYYGANGQVDAVGDYLFDGDYILLAEDGGYFDDPSRGVAYQVSGRFWVNNHAHILKSEDGILGEYICPLLNTFDWMAVVSGTTRLKLTQGGMQRVQVAIPPLAEQRRIVAKLDALSVRLVRAREEAARSVELAASLRTSVVASAFSGVLSFSWRADNPQDSVTDEELEIAFSREKGKPRRKPASGIEWRPSLPLPDCWRWASVDQVSASFDYGSSAKTSDDSRGIPVLRMGNIKDGRLDWSKLKYLPEDHAEFPEMLLEPGDLLFNRTNSFELVGKSAVYGGERAPASFASYLIRVRCSAIRPRLLAWYLNSDFGRRWIELVASQQVGQANVNGSKLKALGIPLPPFSEQIEIERLVDTVFARADRLEAEARKALALIDRLEAAIMAKAFRGELVPQDPNDEPASVLLERIRARRAAEPKLRRGRRPKAAA